MSTPAKPRFFVHQIALDTIRRQAVYQGLEDWEIQQCIQSQIEEMKRDGYAHEAIRSLLTHYADLAVLAAQKERSNIAEACSFYRLVHLHLENVTLPDATEQAIFALWDDCIGDAAAFTALIPIEDIQALIAKTRQLATDAGLPDASTLVFFVNLLELLRRETLGQRSLERIITILEIEIETGFNHAIN